MMILNTVIVAATLMLAGSAATAAADETAIRDRVLFHRPTSPMTTVRDLEPIEQRIEDVDPLATGFRRIELGLRQPFGFEEVYRVPGDDERFMRIDGGLYAVFPQSVYTNRRFGELPLIPANTVFWIGTPDFLLRAETSSSPSEATEAMRRAFVLGQEESMLISEHNAAGSFVAERLLVDEEYRMPSEDEQRRQRHDAHLGAALPRPPIYRATERGRMPVSDHVVSENEDDAEPSADRGRFRQRMHELLHRAARAEAKGR